jgi:hypothetical protein
VEVAFALVQRWLVPRGLRAGAGTPTAAPGTASGGAGRSPTGRKADPATAV